MSSYALLIEIHLLDDRYHGHPEWPPSPFRLFQALIAGAARSTTLTDEDKSALEWLETLKAPIIAAPAVRKGRRFTTFVPDNDLDSVGGDPARIAGIRTGKQINPFLIDQTTPFLYVWNFGDESTGLKHAKRVCALADDLYQFGRGVDMAWASAETLTLEGAGKRLEDHNGPVQRPAEKGMGEVLRCPQPGSLGSLIHRHHAQAERFEKKLFREAPPARFQAVSYNCPYTYLLFDIRENNVKAKFRSQNMTDAAALVERLRDLAAAKLQKGLDAGLVDRTIIGRGGIEADKAQRIRIIPLPSIGFAHADRAIRRALVEAPPDCLITTGDLDWAFSGLIVEEDKIDPETGEVIGDGAILIPAEDHRMLHHYGVETQASHTWRTVTPAALSGQAARRRIDPAHRLNEAKSGKERAKEEGQAVRAVFQALRHTGITQKVSEIHVQRESFEARGERVEPFAYRRFNKERLWHVEITFAEPLKGLLILGDGRYLGLGLMAPVRNVHRDTFVFDINSSVKLMDKDRDIFLFAVRRTLMARDRDNDPGGKVSRLFSGHEPDGNAARSGSHGHIFLAASAQKDVLHRLYVIAPNRADRQSGLSGREQRRFESVVHSLEVVRAGKLGLIRLRSAGPLTANDPILSQSLFWESSTPYIPTRHPKSGQDTAAFIKTDIIAECLRRGLPIPKAEIIDFSTGPRGGLKAIIRLNFKVAVEGPLLLGRSAHSGGGLFKHCTTG